VRRCTFGIGIICAVLTIGSLNVSAQSQYTDQVFRQLQDIYDDVADEEYFLRNYILGSLDEGDDDVWTMMFYGDTEYLIHGACDRDCDDLDLTISDEDGEVVDTDISVDDHPIVSFSPSKDGRYEIKATMYSCSMEPCYFGLAIFND